MKTKHSNKAVISRGKRGMKLGALCAGVLAALANPALALLFVLVLPLAAATIAPLCLQP